jgi:hypothetical protein
MKSNNIDNMIVRQLGDGTIYQRKSDGYINATQICKLAGKDWYDYHRSKGVDKFLKALEVCFYRTVNFQNAYFLKIERPWKNKRRTHRKQTRWA